LEAARLLEKLALVEELFRLEKGVSPEKKGFAQPSRGRNE